MIEFYQTCSICLNGYYVRDTVSKENTCPECFPVHRPTRKMPARPVYRTVNDTLHDPLWRAHIGRRGK